MTTPALAALREEGYRHIVETAADAILVVAPGGIIVHANAQVEKLFGHARADLVGANISLLVPSRFSTGHGTLVNRFFEAPVSRAMGTGTDLFGLRADGTELPIEVSLSPVTTPHGTLVSAAIRDVTARRAVEATARVLAARLAGAVESIQGALAIYDDADTLVLCNSAFRRLVGPLVPGALVGLPYPLLLESWLPAFSFAAEEERRIYRADRLAERGAAEGTSDVRTKDGRNLRVMIRRTQDGGLVQTVWDLSEDVRREQEVREMRAAAETANAAKSEFLASMSHELRTPLSAILGFGQLLQGDVKEPLSSRHLTRVQHILRGGEHLLRLINDILDLSGIEEGRIAISLEPVGVAEVIEQSRITLLPMASRMEVRLSVDAIDQALPMVFVDRTRFAQILMNLGSNAVKYNRKGGAVVFTVSHLDESRVRIAVTDSGVGIPLREQAKVFQPFHRAGQETGSIEGTGIGLAISRRLATLMHAEVGFSSQPGVGSTFWLDVPAHRAGAIAQHAPLSANAPATLSLLQPKVVLYVEDNPANVAFIADLLESFDAIELITAGTAELGIGLAVTRRPAAILMDINLPGMSGLDALHALRASPATASIPVIALTAAASEKDRERGLEAGFFRYLTKPVNVPELMIALDMALARP